MHFQDLPVLNGEFQFLVLCVSRPDLPVSHSLHSDLWSDTEQDLALTQFERSGQTDDSESEYAVQHIIFSTSRVVLIKIPVLRMIAIILTQTFCDTLGC